MKRNDEAYAFLAIMYFMVAFIIYVVANCISHIVN